MDLLSNESTDLLIGLLYMRHLIAFLKGRPKILQKTIKQNAELCNIPMQIYERLLHLFTDEGTMHEKAIRLRTQHHSQKLKLHILCLALILNNFILDMNEISSDLGMDVGAAQTLARQLGCTPASAMTAKLTVPLTMPKARRRNK